MMAGGVSTAVSRTSGRLMPSTPTDQRMPSERTQSLDMTSWKPARPASKRSATTTARASAARLATRATRRAAFAARRGTTRQASA